MALSSSEGLPLLEGSSSAITEHSVLSDEYLQQAVVNLHSATSSAAVTATSLGK